MSPRTLPALVAASLAALAPATALAWEHTRNVWLPEDMPLVIKVADDGAENSPEACEASGGLSGCCEESLPAGYCLQMSQEGFAAWETAQCAEFEIDIRDGVADPNEVAPNIPSAQSMNLNYFTFNDPANEIAETGTLAVNLSRALGQAFILDGSVYSHTYDSDIIFNEDVEFTTHENVLAGACQGQTNARTVMTHEIGHLMGMGHSCEDPGKGGGPCTDPVLREATMYWSEGACQFEAADINEDDLQGITALYGPFATFSCSHQVSDDQVVGVVPFDLNCVIVSDYLGEITNAEWNFGDGGTSDSLTPTHRYDKAGNYTIQVTVQGEREACGPEGWENNFRKVGYVRACDVPTAEFEVEHIDGLQYQMLNDSDVSVYGCISDIQWDVFKGDKATGQPVLDPIKAWEPIIEFPEPGTYTAVMSLGGIAGTGGAAVTFDARNRRGDGVGCDSVGSATGGAAGLLALASLLGLRRRR